MVTDKLYHEVFRTTSDYIFDAIYSYCIFRASKNKRNFISLVPVAFRIRTEREVLRARCRPNLYFFQRSPNTYFTLYFFYAHTFLVNLLLSTNISKFSLVENMIRWCQTMSAVCWKTINITFSQSDTNLLSIQVGVASKKPGGIS